jgi:hypothetical protein
MDRKNHRSMISKKYGRNTHGNVGGQCRSSRKRYTKTICCFRNQSYSGGQWIKYIPPPSCDIGNCKIYTISKMNSIVYSHIDHMRIWEHGMMGASDHTSIPDVIDYILGTRVMISGSIMTDSFMSMYRISYSITPLTGI